MDAVKFAREYGRMCTTPDIPDRRCDDCPIGSKCDEECTIYMAKYPENTVRIVQKWAKEHPRRTYLSVLLDKFPNGGGKKMTIKEALEKQEPIDVLIQSATKGNCPVCGKLVNIGNIYCPKCGQRISWKVIE